MNLTDMVKERLVDYIEEAVGGLVSTNWNIEVNLMRDESRPISTVKFEPIRFEDPTYGRLVPEAGAFANYDFTIYIFDDVDRTQSDEHPSDWAAMDAADAIFTKLLQKSGDATERTTYNIQRIYDVNIKEGTAEDQHRQRRMARYILTGRMYVKWTDA